MFTSLKNSLTVVIPCYNEEKYIGTTLDSIYNQDCVEGLEIVIADGGSKDNTIAVIKECKQRYKDKLKIKTIKGGSVSVGRNKGLIHVKTKYVLFLDADSTIRDKDNLKYNVEKMERGNIDLLTCEIYPATNSIRLKIVLEIFNYSNRILSKFIPFAVGGYFMSRKDKVLYYGGFNEEVSTSEDFLLSKKYSIDKFYISKKKYEQDDRRFNKMGYFGMIRLLVNNFINKDNIEYFKRDVGYW